MPEPEDTAHHSDGPGEPPMEQQNVWSAESRVERQPERLPRLLALHPVTVEAHWHLYEPVKRFYADVLGLGTPNSFVESTGTLLLIFHGDGPDLLVRLTPRPELWANRPRAVLEIPDFGAVRQRLADEMIEHQTLTGWTWPDQRLGLWDPSGNRLEIKQLWRM